MNRERGDGRGGGWVAESGWWGAHRHAEGERE